MQLTRPCSYFLAPLFLRLMTTCLYQISSFLKVMRTLKCLLINHLFLCRHLWRWFFRFAIDHFQGYCNGIPLQCSVHRRWSIVSADCPVIPPQLVSGRRYCWIIPLCCLWVQMIQDEVRSNQNTKSGHVQKTEEISECVLGLKSQ